MYDCIVIGGGIVGSAAAYHLTKNGKETLLLDQFSLPHSWGSSHGAARAIQSSYENPLYSKMAAESLHLWKQLERETDTPLHTKTGLLVIDKPPFDHLRSIISSNKATGVASEELTPDEVARRYPGIVTVPRGSRAILELDAGLLRANKALECFRIQIRKFGGKIRDGEKVVSIIPGRIVTVRTEAGEYRAKSLIIAPGPWINKLLQPLGLTLPVNVVRVTVPFWVDNTAGRSIGYPAFVDFGLDKSEAPYVYGFPSIEYPGLRKFGLHQGVPTDPDARDACDDSSCMEYLSQYLRDRIPGHVGEPAIKECCMYSLTPDEGYIIDTLPHHPNVSFGCGFSGHGFKNAPVTGRILAELALGEELSYDISCLRMKRFPGVFEKSKY